MSSDEAIFLDPDERASEEAAGVNDLDKGLPATNCVPDSEATILANVKKEASVSVKPKKPRFEGIDSPEIDPRVVNARAERIRNLETKVKQVETVHDELVVATTKSPAAKQQALRDVQIKNLQDEVQTLEREIEEKEEELKISRLKFANRLWATFRGGESEYSVGKKALDLERRRLATRQGELRLKNLERSS